MALKPKIQNAGKTMLSYGNKQHNTINTFDIAWVMVCFAVLFALQCLIRVRPHGAVASRLYPWFYAGLFLDEWFTRTTFRLWPAKLHRAPANDTNRA